MKVLGFAPMTCLDSAVFHSPSHSREKLEAALARAFIPHLRKSRFLLLAVADDLATPVERFDHVLDRVYKNM